MIPPIWYIVRTSASACVPKKIEANFRSNASRETLPGDQAASAVARIGSQLTSRGSPPL